MDRPSGKVQCMTNLRREGGFFLATLRNISIAVPVKWHSGPLYSRNKDDQLGVGFFGIFSFYCIVEHCLLTLLVKVQFFMG